MESKFTEGQRVMVPGLKGPVQGMVIALKSFFDKTVQPQIDIKWIDDDASFSTATFDQNVVERAQPGYVTSMPMTTVGLGGGGGGDGSTAGGWFSVPLKFQDLRPKPKRKRPSTKKRSRKKSRSKR